MSDGYEVCTNCGFPLGEVVCDCLDRNGYRKVVQVPSSLHAALTRREARLERAEEALRAVRRAEWGERPSETPFQFEQRMHHIAHRALFPAGEENER